ncbi:fibrinogen alpha chain [Babesia caballi]|uniref:Fibrinogen alpha chain n=1 Tax=Babesia caballi TaxID=5871 RepID=A0AAV4LSA4_BABCB|nr:fibrinogen alpha chain [Babesia caballi]
MTVFGDKSVQSSINALGKGLGYGFLGYQGSESFGSSGIIKNNGGYKSTYGDCNWEQSNASTYAKIFLALAPLVYYFVSFFYWACKDKWKIKKIQSTGSGSPLYYLFNAMDYVQSQLYEEKTGSEIAEALDGYNGFDELKGAYKGSSLTSYDQFLTKLEEDGPTKKLDYPLTNCKILCYAYLKSKQNGKDITDAIDKIKEELITLSTSLTSGSTSSSHDFSALKQKIKNLLEKIKTFNLTTGSSAAGSASTWNPGSSEPGSDGPRKPGSSGTGGTSQAPSSQFSPAGPVAGTLTTFGLGGGAAAAYLLNLGGAKTLVNGLLRIG